jgi:hypothetical protein
LGFFEEIVRRIEVTFGRAQTQVKAEREVFKSNNCLILQRKKEKKKRKKKERKNIQREIYIVILTKYARGIEYFWGFCDH